MATSAMFCFLIIGAGAVQVEQEQIQSIQNQSIQKPFQLFSESASSSSPSLLQQKCFDPCKASQVGTQCEKCTFNGHEHGQICMDKGGGSFKCCPKIECEGTRALLSQQDRQETHAPQRQARICCDPSNSITCPCQNCVVHAEQHCNWAAVDGSHQSVQTFHACVRGLACGAGTAGNICASWINASCPANLVQSAENATKLHVGSAKKLMRRAVKAGKLDVDMQAEDMSNTSAQADLDTSLMDKCHR